MLAASALVAIQVLTLSCNGVSQGPGGARRPTRFEITIDPTRALGAPVRGALFGGRAPGAGFPAQVSAQRILVCPQACALGNQILRTKNGAEITTTTYGPLTVERASGRARMDFDVEIVGTEQGRAPRYFYDHFYGTCREGASS